MRVRGPSLQTLAKVFLTAIVAISILVALCNYVVFDATKNRLYSRIDQLPPNQVGVLLGTSKYARLGGYNDHYRLRLEAAVELFQAGKIEYILISGDNSTRYYDEPSTIRRDLLNSGIPSERVYRDYAGFRTLDSMVRAKKVFGLSRFTVISQATHNMRAVYIAQNRGIDAIAFNAGGGVNTDLNNRIRELLARVLAVMEVTMLNTEPKYLGPTIEIGVSPPT